MILYFVMVLGFGLFFVSAGAVTLIVALVPRVRYQLPIAWRVWIWGTVGFICGYFLSHITLRYLPSIARGVVGGSPSGREAGFMMSFMLFIPPAVAIVGCVLGATLGYFSGRQHLDAKRHTAV